jgi:hypothetical protein
MRVDLCRLRDGGRLLQRGGPLSGLQVHRQPSGSFPLATPRIKEEQQ